MLGSPKTRLGVPSVPSPPGDSQSASAEAQGVTAQADGGGPATTAGLCHVVGPARGYGGVRRTVGGLCVGVTPWHLLAPEEEDDVRQVRVARGEELLGRHNAVQHGARGDTCGERGMSPVPLGCVPVPVS